jgi:hypothetical protein
MIEDRIDVIEPGRNRDRNVVVIPAARKVEKIPVVMRIALLPPPVSPFTVSCRSAFEPYTICAAGFTLAGSTSHIS